MIDSPLSSNRLKTSKFRPEIVAIVDSGNIPEIEGFPRLLKQVFMKILARKYLTIC
ncbi:MAG: hypothetical protein VKK42_24990 [Lyngbya sp.]|nr:hypothetical protein [Lyngbya sp.]